MAQLIPGVDMSQPPGERLAPELVAELALIAPSVLFNESVTTAKLRDKAVTSRKLADGAVTSVKIASGGVESVNLAAGAVVTAAITDGAVTPVKVGTGIMTVFAADGTTPRAVKQVFLTAAEFDALDPPDPNTVYDILDD